MHIPPTSVQITPQRHIRTGSEGRREPKLISWCLAGSRGREGASHPLGPDVANAEVKYVYKQGVV
jgi:hypothetical protein